MMCEEALKPAQHVLVAAGDLPCVDVELDDAFALHLPGLGGDSLDQGGLFRREFCRLYVGQQVERLSGPLQLDDANLGQLDAGEVRLVGEAVNELCHERGRVLPPFGSVK